MIIGKKYIYCLKINKGDGVYEACRANQIKKESINDRVYEIEDSIKKKEKKISLIKSQQHKLILKLVDVDSSISDTIEESIKKLNEDIKCINEEIAIDREKSNELISNNNIFS